MGHLCAVRAQHRTALSCSQGSRAGLNETLAVATDGNSVATAPNTILRNMAISGDFLGCSRPMTSSQIIQRSGSQPRSRALLATSLYHVTSTVRRLLEELEPRARVLPQRVRSLDVGAGLEDQALSARAELFASQHVLNQPGEHGFVHRCEPHQTRVQTLEFPFRHRVEIHTRSRLRRAYRLSPTQQNLSVPRRVDSALTQTTLYLCIRRRLSLSTLCTALTTQPCGLARFRLRPTVWSSSVLVSFLFSGYVSFVQLGRERSPPRNAFKSVSAKRDSAHWVPPYRHHRTPLPCATGPRKPCRACTRNPTGRPHLSAPLLPTRRQPCLRKRPSPCVPRKALRHQVDDPTSPPCGCRLKPGCRHETRFRRHDPARVVQLERESPTVSRAFFNRGAEI
jgi:hypothetical protein